MQWLAWRAAEHGHKVLCVAFDLYGSPLKGLKYDYLSAIQAPMAELLYASKLKMPLSFYDQIGTMNKWYLQRCVRRLLETDELYEPDFHIVENGVPLALFSFMPKSIQDRSVARMSDLSKYFHTNKMIHEREQDCLDKVRKISLPSPLMVPHIDKKQHTKLAIEPHGVPLREIKLAKESVSPFSTPWNIVYVGSTKMDSRIIYNLSKEFSECAFHFFTNKKIPKASNIKAYGFREPNDLMPFIAHADVALSLYDHSSPAYIADTSNKRAIYSLCGVPHVMRRFSNVLEWPNETFYDVNHFDSLVSAVRQSFVSSPGLVKGGNKPRFSDWLTVLDHIIDF